MKGYITTSQAAEKFNVKIRTVRTWIEKGVIKAERFGHYWIIPESIERPRDRRWKKK